MHGSLVQAADFSIKYYCDGGGTTYSHILGWKPAFDNSVFCQSIFHDKAIEKALYFGSHEILRKAVFSDAAMVEVLDLLIAHPTQNINTMQ